MSSTQVETIAQQATSEEQTSEVSEEQTLNSSDVGQSVTADEPSVIPQKFVGKSAADILQAYRELEKDRGRLASELGSVRKEHEDIQERYRQLERQALQYRPTQVSSSLENLPSENYDPLSVLDSKFDEDPRAAIKEAFAVQKRAEEARQVQARHEAAAQWYHKQKQENQDYARREELMRQAAIQFQHIINPQYSNSIEALQALDLISRGMDINYYQQQAVKSAQKGGLSAREEKRKAFSESTGSIGETPVRVEDLSLAEMEKLFGFADK